MNNSLIKKGEAWIMLLLSFTLFRLSFITPFYWTVFFSFIPFLYALKNISGFKTKLAAGFAFGVVYFAFIAFWTTNVNLFIFIIAVFSQSLFMALFASGHHLLRRRDQGPWASSLILTCLWVAIEYLRSLGYLGMPAGLIGYQLLPNLPSIQSASLFGIYGLSFFVFLINALLFHGLQKSLPAFKRASLIGAALALITANAAYGAYTLARPDMREGQTVAVIQANIKPERKWDVTYIERNVAKHERLSRLALAENPDLIIWPETAVTCFLLHPERKNILDGLAAFTRETHTPLLTGTLDITFDPRRGKSAFNSAVLISKDGEVDGRYNKIKLVPVVEKAPVKSLIPLLRKVEGLMPIYDPGQSFTQFTNRGTRFSTVICFEALFPNLVRTFVRHGALWIVNITNDQPALGDLAFYYKVNADMTILRAVENRRSIVRAANTGISMVIDPYGRVTERLPIGEDAYFSAPVMINEQTTVYNRFGDVIAFLSIGIVSAGLLRKFSLKRKRA